MASLVTGTLAPASALGLTEGICNGWAAQAGLSAVLWPTTSGDTAPGGQRLHRHWRAVLADRHLSVYCVVCSAVYG
ncbi:hypothetical protein ACSHWB_38955 [Lentzea sp. HUAS TT2]|uniref:hypothetical protein n=1 Tax=Lentzea sp. HUAS TT2 TaxID=3447454 RepID=UPI003F715786